MPAEFINATTEFNGRQIVIVDSSPGCTYIPFRRAGYHATIDAAGYDNNGNLLLSTECGHHFNSKDFRQYRSWVWKEEWDRARARAQEEWDRSQEEALERRLGQL